jgi:hypothetical protein
MVLGSKCMALEDKFLPLRSGGRCPTYMRHEYLAIALSHAAHVGGAEGGALCEKPQ